MTTNRYFDHYSNRTEQSLYDDLNIEHIQLRGMDMFYIPRSMYNENEILGEDGLSKFQAAYTIEFMVETVDGFEGNGEFLTKFGLELQESATFTCSRTRFEEEITRMDPDIVQPREGDLIYFPLNKGLFEIKYVDYKQAFYQLGDNYTYKCSVELMQFSQEELNTGIEYIDDLATELENDDSIENDVYANNDEIQEDADANLDFDEANPFGGF